MLSEMELVGGLKSDARVYGRAPPHQHVRYVQSKNTHNKATVMNRNQDPWLYEYPSSVSTTNDLGSRMRKSATMSLGEMSFQIPRYYFSPTLDLAK